MDAAVAAPADKMARSTPRSTEARSSSEAIYKIWAMCQDIVGSPIEFVPDASLADLGIDELGMADLLYQIDQEFGEGLVSAEDVRPLQV